MSIQFVENPTANRIPFPDIDPSVLHPAWLEATGSGGLPDGPAPSLVQGGPRPLQHTLEPFERYYYETTHSFPAPPPPDDPRWDKIRLFLMDTVDKGVHREARLEIVCCDVWKDRAVGDDEQLSHGAWAKGYDDNYWNPPFAVECPQFRKVGWEPWGQEHAAGNHYETGLWCIEEFMRTGNMLCWDRAWLIALHLAGQGMNQSTGALYNEKSRWWQAGRFTVGGTQTPWSHHWSSVIQILTLLTGELQDVTNKILTYGWFNPAYSTGYWGIRPTAWCLRAMRCADMLLPAHRVSDDARAFDMIDRAFHIPESRGIHWFPNDGSQDGGVDVWQDGLMLTESHMWHVVKGDAEASYMRCLPFAEHHLTNNRVQATGQMAYYRTNSQGPVFSSHFHTSMWLPFMAEMVVRGDLPQAELRKSCEYVLEHMPYTVANRIVYGKHRAGRGLLWVRRPEDPTDEGTRPDGPASPKIRAGEMYGLRGDVLAVAGY